MFLRPTPDGVSAAALLGRQGSVEVMSYQNPVRALAELNGTLYAVADRGLHNVSTGEKLADVGDIVTGIASTGTHIAFIAGGVLYVWDGSNITFVSPPVSSPVGLGFLDGFLIVAGSNGGRGDAIAVSNVDNFTKFDILDVAFAESNGDPLRGLIVDHGRVWLFGSRTIEIWYNSGAADFPLARISGNTKERGCLSNRLIIKDDNRVFWIGDDKNLYVSGGGIPEVASTREVKEDWDGDTLEDIFSFTDRGHKFIAVRRTGKPTWCLDLTTNIWSQRTTGLGLDPWFASCALNLDGVQYLGTDDGRVVKLVEDEWRDVGSRIKAQARTSPNTDGGRYVRATRLSGAFAGGHYASPLDDPPEVVLRVSGDGVTWGRERIRRLPDQGQYGKRVEFHGLAAHLRAHFELTITDNICPDIWGVEIG